MREFTLIQKNPKDGLFSYFLHNSEDNLEYFLTSLIDTDLELEVFQNDESYYKVRAVLSKENFSRPYDIDLKVEWPEESEIQYFKDSPSLDFCYNDGLQHRSRHSRLLLYAQNRIWEFKGQNIENVVYIVGTPIYTKNGKWSNTTYSLKTVAGVKWGDITQDWDSGRYVNNHTTLTGIKKDLGLNDCSSEAVKIYLKECMFSVWKRYISHNEQMAIIEESAEKQNTEVIRYEYVKDCSAKRVGFNMLLIDREVFNGKNSEKVQVVQETHVSGFRGGTTKYKLMVLASCKIEELPEYSPYDPSDDSLETRGYFLNNDGMWIKELPKQEEKKTDEFTLNDLVEKFNTNHKSNTYKN